MITYREATVLDIPVLVSMDREYFHTLLGRRNSFVLRSVSQPDFS
jgi:hypothetical protein